jgi:hypothetical protein
MDYEQAEADIVTKLAPLVTAGCEVVPLPDTQGELLKVIDKPRITVAWNGTDADPSQSTSAIVQRSTVNFEITIQWGKKRGSNGIYNLIKLVKLYLLGFQPDACGKMWVTKEELADYDAKNIWNYRAFYSANCVEVEAPDEAADIILSQLTFNTTAQ